MFPIQFACEFQIIRNFNYLFDYVHLTQHRLICDSWQNKKNLGFKNNFPQNVFDVLSCQLSISNFKWDISHKKINYVPLISNISFNETGCTLSFCKC